MHLKTQPNHTKIATACKALAKKHGFNNAKVCYDGYNITVCIGWTDKNDRKADRLFIDLVDYNCAQRLPDSYVTMAASVSGPGLTWL